MRRQGPGRDVAGEPGRGAAGAGQAGGAAASGRALLAARIRTLLGDPAVALRIEQGLRRRADAGGLKLPARLADFCRDDRGGLRLAARSGRGTAVPVPGFPSPPGAAGAPGRPAPCRVAC
ncbi:MAG: hypothetical protein N2Z62_07180 [Rhodobacteraceae bacterium]|nr:hypothetical protein [Paracoccaceae bacterium]